MTIKKREQHPPAKNVTAIGPVEAKIHTIRGIRVMLDADLAELYAVETKNLNLTVKRNLNRFPDDFMFQLSEGEFQDLRFQFATSSLHGGRRTRPYAFTEQGIAMLSGLLNSDIAIAVNIAIMRAFVSLRRFAVSHEELAKKFGELEKAVKGNTSDIKLIFNTINTMLNPRAKKKPQIGFKPKDD